MRPVSYSRYYNEEGGDEMRYGKEDFYFKQVRFESYAELNAWLKAEKLTPGVNTRYDGTQTCGDVMVTFSVNHMNDRELVLNKIAELFKFL